MSDNLDNTSLTLIPNPLSSRRGGRGEVITLSKIQ